MSLASPKFTRPSLSHSTSDLTHDAVPLQHIDEPTVPSAQLSIKNVTKVFQGKQDLFK